LFRKEAGYEQSQEKNVTDIYLQSILASAALIFWFVPIVKILRKAGYSGWWSVVILVPLLNFIMFWVFAFAQWPNLREQDG